MGHASEVSQLRLAVRRAVFAVEARAWKVLLRAVSVCAPVEGLFGEVCYKGGVCRVQH